MLRGTAADVWKTLAQRPLTTPELSAHLSESYQASPHEVANDVESFLAGLASHGLIQEASET